MCLLLNEVVDCCCEIRLISLRCLVESRQSSQRLTLDSQLLRLAVTWEGSRRSTLENLEITAK